MGGLKEQVIDVLEALEGGADYETVANQMGWTVPQVVQVARDYGDFDDSTAP